MSTEISIVGFQSLFYWIIYSYTKLISLNTLITIRFNPYFTGLSILILRASNISIIVHTGFNPYFTGLSILIITIL